MELSRDTPSAASSSVSAGIRPMTAENIPAILELEKRTFPNPWTADQFLSELALGKVTVARIAGENPPAGFAMATLIQDEMHIGKIAVSLSHRRQGIGSALIGNLLDYAKSLGGTQVFLEVRDSNSAARGFYGALGFLEISVRRRYYCDTHENAIIMSKQI